MGTALPIIASNVGGISDMVKNDESGLLIQPQLDDLVHAMKKVMDSLELRIRLGNCAYDNSAQFSSTNMLNGYMEIYLNELKCNKVKKGNASK